MTNKEKYPNTDDALKAFAEHNKRCDCDCTFEQWLDMQNIPPGICASIAMMMATLSSDVSGVECPICHGKNGKITRSFEPAFRCPDCNIFLSKDGINLDLTVAGFKSLLADLCKKNNKKD